MPSALKLEAVSRRLRVQLIHPNRSAYLVGLSFSPDGRRILAGDYPGGVIQVWEVASGKQLARIETGHGYRGSGDYPNVSPDWTTVYVAREKLRSTRVEKGGKRLTRWEADGDVRAWDLATGRLKETFAHRPARGVAAMLLAPDGRSFVTFDLLPGEAETGPERAATLWDVRARTGRPLDGKPRYWSAFSPDGKTLAGPAEKDGMPVVELYDAATGKRRRTIATGQKGGRVGYLAFAPGGQLLAGQVRGPRDQGDRLVFWDAEGAELASFPGAKGDLFLFMAFSPDGRTLAVTGGRGPRGKLFLFDVPGGKLARTVLLGEKESLGRPVFSPDGRWLAVSAQVVTEEAGGRDLSPEDRPQPRIRLLDPGSGDVRETIVCPQGLSNNLRFSPDGRTLASNGLGRVLLWDLTRPPGGR